MNGSLGNKRKSEIGSKRRRRLLKQQDEDEEEEEEERESGAKMVAISLYRGNMHRVSPDVPRRWLMPKPQISLKDFRNLLLRRSKALSVIPSTSASPPRVVAGNPNSAPELVKVAAAVEIKVEDAAVCGANPRPVLDQVASVIGDDATQVAEKEKEKEEEKEKKEKEEDKAPEKVADVAVPASEGGQKQEPIDEEKEKRKREVEEKLHVLNEKKHNLVKALKQILNAEEELKRRSNVQAGRPPLPLQPDASNDSGSMTRHATPRAGSEANIVVDMEGGEGEDASNPNPQGRQLLRVNSTSPSAESALRRPPYFQHNVGSHPSRAAVVVSGSPSRFAPSGNQSHPPNLPTVSVTGTNYVASSPSPAASGGTSGFRDARHPSPWN